MKVDTESKFPFSFEVKFSKGSLGISLPSGREFSTDMKVLFHVTRVCVASWHQRKAAFLYVTLDIIFSVLHFLKVFFLCVCVCELPPYFTLSDGRCGLQLCLFIFTSYKVAYTKTNVQKKSLIYHCSFVHLDNINQYILL